MAILRAASSLAATAIQASRIQHERDQSYKAKDEFLAMLGHELRNPLAPIRAGATVLQMDEVAPATIKKTAAIIERQVKHMTGLVDSLLDVSRLSTGALILAEDVIDMKEVLHDAFEQISPFFDSKAHSVSMHISNDEAYVYGDKSRLVQVVSNLLNNASKYTANGGSIEVVLETQAEAVIVKVTDNGIGIESAMLLKVFHLFTQAKRSADRFGGGLGVGLALAKQLVELHDGRLTAHSAGIGLGATFEVRLKRMTGSAELRLPVFEGSAPRTTVRPLRILVVDDNRDAAEVIAEMLKIFGHEVFIDFHPLDALRRAPEVNPDIYLLDIGLPEIDGYELARRLKLDSRLDRFTLVALTGYGQVEDQRKAYSAGFNFHCVKPIDIEHLSSILSEVSTQISANPR
jgi:CheY-like chemotaxis protein